MVLAQPHDGLVGRFLASNTDFTFDVEEYIQSLSFSKELAARLSAFETSVNNDLVFNYESRLIDFLRRQSLSIPAFVGLTNIANIASLPLLTKETLRRDLAEYFNRDCLQDKLWTKCTSGTTGAPLTFLYSPRFYFEELLLPVAKILSRAKLQSARSTPVGCIHVTDTATVKNRVVSGKK